MTIFNLKEHLQTLEKNINKQYNGPPLSEDNELKKKIIPEVIEHHPGCTGVDYVAEAEVGHAVQEREDVAPGLLHRQHHDPAHQSYRSGLRLTGSRSDPREIKPYRDDTTLKRQDPTLEKTPRV